MSRPVNDFTACPNGRFEDGRPHDFTGYQPADTAADQTPLIFCERCGEVRLLVVAPAEPAMVREPAKRGKRRG